MAHTTFSLSKFTLDENGTFLDALGTDGVAGTSDDNRYRSLYVEEPSAYLIPDLDIAEGITKGEPVHTQVARIETMLPFCLFSIHLFPIAFVI